MKLNLRHGSIWSLTHSSKNGNRCIHQCKASWYILVGKPLGLAVWRIQFGNVTICQGSWCIWLTTPTDHSQFLTISEPLSDQWHIASHEKWRCNEETPKHIWTPPMEASGVVLDMAPPEIFAKCQSSQISSFQSQGLKHRLKAKAVQWEPFNTRNNTEFFRFHFLCLSSQRSRGTFSTHLTSSSCRPRPCMEWTYHHGQVVITPLK